VQGGRGVRGGAVGAVGGNSMRHITWGRGVVCGSSVSPNKKSIIASTTEWKQDEKCS